MILRYIYSACIVIETPDLRICCDPWFTQGIYDGAWFQYPVVDDPITTIGPIDFVYISHIHPDHYDPTFLRRLMDTNSQCQILIGNQNQHFLHAKMNRDGFTPQPIAELSIGLTDLAVIPNDPDGEISIDSALVVRNPDFSVANMNDCPFDANQVEAVRDFCGGRLDVAFLPYAGAGPYPQAYRFGLLADRDVAAARKKEQFLNLFEQYLDVLKPRYAVPFAGLYYLGGKRRWMNSHRGVPDALEVADRFGDQVIVLEEAIGCINLVTGEIQNPRTVRYDEQLLDAAIQQFDHQSFPYESDPAVSEQVLIEKLRAAHQRAIERITDRPPSWLCFKIPSTRFLCVHADRPGEVVVADSIERLCPREEFYLDGRLFCGLLDRRYHWNNAEIGSHFEFRREPEEYDRRVYNLLNFLHV